MPYKVTCPQCDFKIRAKNIIEAKHYRNKHVKELDHYECEYERIA